MDLKEGVARVFDDIRIQMGSYVTIGVETALQAAADYAIEGIRSRAPWPDIADSFKIIGITNKGRNWTAEIGSDNPLALWMEEGTKAHPIDAKPKSALSFWWERESTHFFGKHVNHPGTKAHHFVSATMHEDEDSIYEIINEVLNET